MKTPDCTQTVQLEGTSAGQEFEVQIDLCYTPSQDGSGTLTIASVTVTFVKPQPPLSPPLEQIELSLKGALSAFRYVTIEDDGEESYVKGTFNIVRFGGDPAANCGVWANVYYPVELVSGAYQEPEDEVQPEEPNTHFEGILIGSTFLWKMPGEELSGPRKTPMTPRR